MRPSSEASSMALGETTTLSKVALPSAYLKVPEAPDAGLRSLDHYRLKLPPWRHRLREKLIPLLRQETPYLAWAQQTVRSPALDSYFAITANLGTHTFFMVMLPILFWCGYTTLGRAMVHILASGVFFSGYIKDLLCLPRPLSPPLERITMSGSAALEYGFPSTHATNAVSVVAYALCALTWPETSIDPKTQLTLQVLLFWYATSIVLGRVYCGMHGFLDVIVGSVLGAILGVLQWTYGEPLDHYLYSSGSYAGAALIFCIILVLVRTHPEPADDCPCFDDSLAFAGVMIGCEIGNWHYAVSGWAWDSPVRATVPFQLETMGYGMVIARIIVGVLTIFVWREVMKPSLLRGLPPLFRIIEKLGLSLPRRYHIQASEYKKVPSHLKDDDVIPSVSELPSLINSIRHRRKRAVSVGPQSAADAYETLAYRDLRRKESISKMRSSSRDSVQSRRENGDYFSISSGVSSKSKPPSMTVMPHLDMSKFESYERMMGQGTIVYTPLTPATEPLMATEHENESAANDEREERAMFSQLERPRVRYDVEVVTKLVVYAGIALLAVEFDPILFELVGLGILHQTS